MNFWASSERVSGFVHQSFLFRPSLWSHSRPSWYSSLSSLDSSFIGLYTLAFSWDHTDAMKYRCINAALFRLFYSSLTIRPSKVVKYNCWGRCTRSCFAFLFCRLNLQTAFCRLVSKCLAWESRNNLWIQYCCHFSWECTYSMNFFMWQFDVEGQSVDNRPYIWWVIAFYAFLLYGNHLAE